MNRKLQLDMQLTSRRSYAQVHLGAIDKNLSILDGYARTHYELLHGSVPMVKCNAYGHGLVQVGKRLERHSKVLGLGVATLEEALLLRAERVSKPIWVFADSVDWDLAFLEVSLREKLTLMVHKLEDLKRLAKAGSRFRNLKFHLKFNTGMNRLGLDSDVWQQAAELCRREKLRPEGLCSHLMTPEKPRAKETLMQLDRFRAALGFFPYSDSSYIHCSGTGGILEEKALQLGGLKMCNAIRPGIGLYGYAMGITTAAMNVGKKLQPALVWKAKALKSRCLERDEVIGYGATFRTRTKTWQTVLGVGYGDGFSRSLSNQSIAVRGRSTKVLGRVSMDLCALNFCMGSSKEWVTLLGEGQAQGNFMAKQAGTNIYEVLTSISPRVPRMYIE